MININILSQESFRDKNRSFLLIYCMYVQFSTTFKMTDIILRYNHKFMIPVSDTVCVCRGDRKKSAQEKKHIDFK